MSDDSILDEYGNYIGQATNNSSDQTAGIRSGNIVEQIGALTERQNRKDLISNTSGRYIARVLRVETVPQHVTSLNTLTDQINVMSESPAANEETRVRIKARISAFHSALPYPTGYESLPAVNEELTEGQKTIHHIIDMHDTFEAQTLGLPTPEVGDLVWCTYGNLYGMQGGVYLGHVTQGTSSSVRDPNDPSPPPNPNTPAPADQTLPEPPEGYVAPPANATARSLRGLPVPGPRPGEPRRVEIALGLAAWDQNAWLLQNPNHTPALALQRSFDEAYRLGVRKMRYWSGKFLVPPSAGGMRNKFSRRIRRFLEQLEKPSDLDFGVWIDGPAGAMATPEYARSLRELGFTTAIVHTFETQASKDGRRPIRHNYNNEALRSIAENFRSNGFNKIVLSNWPRPTKEHIDSLADVVPGMLEALGTNHWEADLEGQWKVRFARGFGGANREENYLLASEYLVRKMREITRAVPSRGNGSTPRIILTTVPGHRENGANAAVAPHVDQINIQAYSTSARGSRERGTQYVVPFDRIFGPGSMQNLAIRKARQITGTYTPQPQRSGE
jgi:hypothetical protein